MRLVTGADNRAPLCKNPRSPWPWRRMASGGANDSHALRLRLARKERKNRQRILKIKEYNRLRAMVPSIASKPKVSKVTVIEEAVRYIDQLHSALIERLQARGLPPCLQGLPLDVSSLAQADIRQLVRVLVENRNASKARSSSTPDSTPSTTGVPTTSRESPVPSWPLRLAEKSRSLPSYMLRLQKKTS